MSISYRLGLRTALLGAAIALACTAEATQIQGKIANAKGVALAGVTIEFSGGLHTAVTNSRGQFAVLVPGGVGEFTLTPWKTGYFFAPGTVTVTVSGSDVTVNFVATQAHAYLAGPPTVIITSYPASVTIGDPVVIQWQVFNVTPSSNNHIEWISDADIFTTNSTKNTLTKKVGTTYWSWFSAPASNCTLSVRIHLTYGSNLSLNSTVKTIAVGTGTPAMPTIVLISPPTGANPGDTLTITWQVQDGKPTTVNNVTWGVAANAMVNSTPQRLVPDATLGPSTFQYSTKIVVPNFVGTLFLQVHSVITGQDYFSSQIGVTVPNPANPLIVIEPKGDPNNRDVSAPPTCQVGTSANPWGAVNGVLTLTCTAKVNPAGFTGSFLPYSLKNPSDFVGWVRISIEPIGDSIVSWQNPTTFAPSLWGKGNLAKPATASPIMGLAVFDGVDQFSVKAIFTNLPTHNSAFGPHKAFFQIIDITKGVVIASVSVPITVFYGRYDKNNPTAIKETTPGTENWFYYWKEGQVVKKSSGWKFSNELGGVEGYYDPFGAITPPPNSIPGPPTRRDPVNVYVTTLAPGINYGPESFFKQSGEKTTSTGHGAGPACCAEKIAHYLELKFYHDNFLVPSGDANSAYGDPDLDGVPNFVEQWRLGVATDPNDPDTYGLGLTYPAFASNGDMVLRALRKEMDPGIGTNAAADWSWPWKGFTANVPPGGNVPTVSITIQGPNTIKESNVGDFTNVIIRRTGATTNALTVQYNIPKVGTNVANIPRNVTVAPPPSANGNTTITIPAGANNLTLWVYVQPPDGKGDGLVEGALTLEFDFVPSVAGTYVLDGAQNKVVVNVTDDM